MRQDEAREQQLGKLELDEALETLVHTGVRAGKVDDLNELVEHDAAGLNHGQDQGAQDVQTSRVEREVLGEQKVQAMLWRSAPGVLHTRKHRTGADFSCLPHTFDP